MRAKICDNAPFVLATPINFRYTVIIIDTIMNKVVAFMLVERSSGERSTLQ